MTAFCSVKRFPFERRMTIDSSKNKYHRKLGVKMAVVTQILVGSDIEIYVTIVRLCSDSSQPFLIVLIINI